MLRETLMCGCAVCESVHSTQDCPCEDTILCKILHMRGRLCLYCGAHLQGAVKVVQGVLAVQLARHSCAVSALPRACDRRQPVLQLHPERSQEHC